MWYGRRHVCAMHHRPGLLQWRVRRPQHHQQLWSVRRYLRHRTGLLQRSVHRAQHGQQLRLVRQRLLRHDAVMLERKVRLYQHQLWLGQDLLHVRQVRGGVQKHQRGVLIRPCAWQEKAARQSI